LPMPVADRPLRVMVGATRFLQLETGFFYWLPLP
jgi:hypothetical protein